MYPPPLTPDCQPFTMATSCLQHDFDNNKNRVGKKFVSLRMRNIPLSSGCRIIIIVNSVVRLLNIFL